MLKNKSIVKMNIIKYFHCFHFKRFTCFSACCSGKINFIQKFSVRRKKDKAVLKRGRYYSDDGTNPEI